MAIVQISQIQIRRGLNQDLPQLASAEMGWSVDTQQLYIGNGSIAEGAPQTGVTEIMTNRSIAQATAGFNANIAAIYANVTAVQNSFSAFQTVLLGNVALPTTATLAAGSSGSITGFASNDVIISYSLTQQSGTLQRTGTIVASRIGSSVYYSDDYVETSTSDIVLGVTANSTQGNLYYSTTTSTTMTYVIKVIQ